MNIRLLPRLSATGYASLFELLSGREKVPIRDYSHLVTYGASGGTPAPDDAFALVSGLRQIAQELEFPLPSSQEARSQFDIRASMLLAQSLSLGSGEALRDDVWAFMATVLAPDLVAWRFPDGAADRYAGGLRNAFQRLWMRGIVLDRSAAVADRWALVEELTEDAMIQIFERPSLAAQKRVARALAEAWLRCAAAIGRGPMQDVMRKATKLVRLQNEIRDLAYVPEQVLAAELDGIFRLCAGATAST